MMAVARGVACRAISEAPPTDQVRLLPRGFLEKAAADLFARARDFPYAHVAHLAPEINVIVPTAFAQVVRGGLFHRGKTARVSETIHQFAIVVEAHAVLSGNRREMIPAIGFQ